MAKLALLAITNSTGKTFILDEFHDYLNHAFIKQKFQQLQVKPQYQRVSYAVVQSKKMAPVFLASKKFLCSLLSEQLDL